MYPHFLSSEIADKLSLVHEGTDILVERISDLKTIFPKSILYLEKLTEGVLPPGPLVFLLPESLREITVQDNRTKLFTSEPKISFIKLLALFDPGISKTKNNYANDDNFNSCHINKKLHIGPGSVIKENVSFGDNVTLVANNYIGANVTIGNNVTLHPGVVIMDRCVIGDDTIIHPNSVIGADGFGYQTIEGTIIKIPQIGNVVIGKNVEIGACSTVDRAAITSTVISDNVKIDNHVQIGHNVFIGENTIIAGSVAVAGSTHIGNRVTIGGMAGFGDHVTIEDDVMVAGGTGVYPNKTITKNRIIFGCPPRDLKEELKIQSIINKLPDIYNYYKEQIKINK